MLFNRSLLIGLPRRLEGYPLPRSEVRTSSYLFTVAGNIELVLTRRQRGYPSVPRRFAFTLGDRGKNVSPLYHRPVCQTTPILVKTEVFRLSLSAYM